MDEAMLKKACAKLHGLTRDLIHSLIKDYGCDLIFRFNYDGINAGIANRKVGKHMEALLGPAGSPTFVQRPAGFFKAGEFFTVLPDLPPICGRRFSSPT